MRLSKKELVLVKKDIQNYQVEKYPELSHSIVQHGKRKKNVQTEKEYQYKLRTGKVSNKEQLMGILQTSFKNALSKADLFEKLILHDVSIYSRNGKVAGVVYKGRKFRFSRLGFTEKLNELDKSVKRGKEIQKIRDKMNEKALKRSLDK